MVAEKNHPHAVTPKTCCGNEKKLLQICMLNPLHATFTVKIQSGNTIQSHHWVTDSLWLEHAHKFSKL